MGKKIVLSEEQLQNVIGINEDAFYYLGGSSAGGNTEVGVEGNIEDRLGIPQHSDDHVFGLHKREKYGDEEEGEDDEIEYTYDDLGSMITPSGYWSNRLGSHRTIASMSEGKKKIDEDNQALGNTQFFAKDDITGAEYKAKGDEATIMQINRARKSGNTRKANLLDKTLKDKQNAEKRRKKFNKDVLGLDNQFQKSGGEKTQVGTSHTKKNNGSLVTYFN